MKPLYQYILETSTSCKYGEGLSAVDVLKHFNGQKPINGTKSPTHGSMMPYTLIQKFFEIYNREFSSDSSKHPFYFSKTGLVEIPIEYHKYADELKRVLDSSESKKRGITYEINATEFILKRAGDELHLKFRNGSSSGTPRNKGINITPTLSLQDYIGKVKRKSSRSPYASREDWLPILIDHIKNYLYDEYNPSYKPSTKYFLLKKREAQDSILHVDKANQEMALDILKKLGTLTINSHPGDNKLKAQLVVNGLDRPIQVQSSGKSMDSDEVKDADQESATAIVFNNIIQEIKENPGFRPSDEWLIDICNSINESLGLKLNASWAKSIGLASMCLIDYLSSLGANVGNFRMERAQGHQKGRDVADAMLTFIKKYAKHLGVQRDTIDPSDTFVYDVTNKKKVLDIISEASLLIDKDFDSVRQFILDNFYTQKTPIFGGISLKKVNNPHLELCNINDELDKMIVTKIGEPIISKEGKGVSCSVLVDGKFGEYSDQARIDFRASGGNTMRASVVLLDKKGKSLSQGGDCPIKKFDDIVGLKNHYTRNKEENFAIFQEFIKNKPKDDIAKIIAMGVKRSKYNLPYIIIH